MNLEPLIMNRDEPLYPLSNNGGKNLQDSLHVMAQ